MNEDDLKKELKALADCFPRQASARVEREVLAGFRRKQRQRAWLRVGMAACLAAMASLAIWRMKPAPSPSLAPKSVVTTVAQVTPKIETVSPEPPVETAIRPRRRIRRPKAIDANFAGFISLPSAISGVPLGNAYIVRTKVSAAQLGFAGLPVIASDLHQQVDADVLVGSDGMARAIRLPR
jgi:hypothetical protein